MSKRLDRSARATGYIPDGGTCAATGKVIWFSRADAKRVLRRFKGKGLPAPKGMHAYECHHVPEGHPYHWHHGHKPGDLVAGEVSRTRIQETQQG